MREGRLRLYAKIKIFAQPAGRSRPFSGRSLVLAEGRPMPLAVIYGREMQITLATASVAMLISFRSSSAEAAVD